ncbi:Chromosome-associated kinesin kif4, partial [Globisporangium splendens]
MRKDGRKSGTSTPSRVAVRIRSGTPATDSSAKDTSQSLSPHRSPSLRSSSAEHSMLSTECLSPSHAFGANAVHFNYENQSKTFTCVEAHNMLSTRYAYAHIFVFVLDPRTIDMYTEALQPLLTPFLNGFNVTVLAYGQTGSGKTYTVGNKTSVTPATSPARSVNPNAESTPHKIGENDGLLPRFLCGLFTSLRKEPSVKTIHVSFLEIYCDELQVDNVEKALELMNLGRSKQVVSSNALNDTSSRSHAIYTMEVSRKFVNEIKKTKLMFVDLAGSERLKKTQVEGVRMKESIQINASEIEINLLQEQICFLKQQLDQANAAAIAAQAVGTKISPVPFPLQNLKKSDDHRAPEQPKCEESASSAVELPLPVIPVAKFQLSTDEPANEREECRLEGNSPSHGQSIGQEEVHPSSAELIATPVVVADVVNSIETKLVESPPESTTLEVHPQAESETVDNPDVQQRNASTTLEVHSQAECGTVDASDVQQPVPMRENLEAIGSAIVARKSQCNTALQRFLESFQVKENGSNKSVTTHHDENASAVADVELTPPLSTLDAFCRDQMGRLQSECLSSPWKSAATQDIFNDTQDNEEPPKVSLFTLASLSHEEEVHTVTDNHPNISEALPAAATWFTESSDSFVQNGVQDTKRANCGSAENDVGKVNGRNKMEHEMRCHDKPTQEENQKQGEPQSLLAKLIARRILSPVQNRQEQAEDSAPPDKLVVNDPLAEEKFDDFIPEYLAQMSHECNVLINSAPKSFRLADELGIEQHEAIDPKPGIVPVPTKQLGSQEYDTRSNQHQDSPKEKNKSCKTIRVTSLKVSISKSAKLESLIQWTKQLQTDEFGSGNNQEEENLLPNGSSGTVEACLERMTSFFEKRSKVKRRLGQLKRRLYQFQLILGFPSPVFDENELQNYKVAYQEVLLQGRLDFCEAIAAQRLYKRLQSWEEAARSFSIPATMTKKKASFCRRTTTLHAENGSHGTCMIARISKSTCCRCCSMDGSPSRQQI